ncbi:hypothetical protein EI427_17350 [Flammeovirga pectinis]|uniref:Uncharacterized protein n=1 Tax=Flammeovirga pectinis TaxID=2494373 RepID=A0A3Q9FT85_9BACT|nr:hypothetical protein EI427_17350 [Flammeovirga pectinis]
MDRFVEGNNEVRVEYYYLDNYHIIANSFENDIDSSKKINWDNFLNFKKKSEVKDILNKINLKSSYPDFILSDCLFYSFYPNYYVFDKKNKLLLELRYIDNWDIYSQNSIKIFGIF